MTEVFRNGMRWPSRSATALRKMAAGLALMDKQRQTLFAAADTIECLTVLLDEASDMLGLVGETLPDPDTAEAAAIDLIDRIVKMMKEDGA